MMKSVLVTGADGFIGRNLIASLRQHNEIDVRSVTRATTNTALDDQLRNTDVVFHLAGINRPQSDAEYTSGNVDFTRALCARLKRFSHTPKIIFSSSIQAVLDSPYGVSKRKAEAELQQFANETGAQVAIYRLKNVFGKWCRPNYNSAVATFCYNIARELPIEVSDIEKEVELVYIDDVIDAFLAVFDDTWAGARVVDVPLSFTATLGRLVALIESFRASRFNLTMPNLADPLTKRLYATYISGLPEDGFDFELETKSDHRGILAEFIKSEQFGQVFVSRTKPGITRGNHYHDTKVEKFLVLDGDAMIRFRHIEREDVIEYSVSGRTLRVVDIPPGYTHSIENVGTTEMIVLFWASEIFNPRAPDTASLSV